MKKLKEYTTPIITERLEMERELGKRWEGRPVGPYFLDIQILLMPLCNRTISFLGYSTTLLSNIAQCMI